MARRNRRAGRDRAVPAPRPPGRHGHWRADGTPKVRYATEDDAHRAWLQARLERGADLDTYRCELCGGWHLGNRPA